MSSIEAVEQAVSFLTTPLSKTTISPKSLSILRTTLTQGLHALFLRSHGAAVGLRLAAADRNPPECIARACEASGVVWSEWLFLIGGGMGLDLDVNVSKHSVTASFCRAGTPSLGLVTVWQKEEPQLSSRELLYADDDSDELFDEISRSQHSPSWLSTWTTGAGPAGAAASAHAGRSMLSSPMAVPKMQSVPLSARSSPSSQHSRSSSYSSQHSSSSPNHLIAPHHQMQHQHQQQVIYGYGNGNPERTGSACSNRSGGHRSASPSNSLSSLSLSEDGSSGSSGGISWTRRGTVLPGPQQSAILAARQAHQHQQQQMSMPMPPVPAQYRRHSPSESITSLASVSSSSSSHKNGNGGHRRQRSSTTASNGGVPVAATGIVVDPSKASVTAYDGGKTKVMTGGVMLGSINSSKSKKQQRA